ncbi:cytochrome c oxidase assembly protein COX20, mitochondrial [Neocloeon triangulifer]|uniref:cytochrome c oxidase assembly protein COX20, mitochondrial n=1 Tax=Neocloeon triangulifer TaxID=2078957 RepID=UPI00286EE15C|nr:cytochrome c oxidase assembly protein COX20, mitochondrial [Neocloeon triangulifer]
MSTDQDDSEKKSLYLFGRDVSQIPCFRSSFLYGIGTGFAGGLVYFMSTSRASRATHVGFASFFFSTFIYWGVCRYNYAVSKFTTARIREATQLPQQRAIVERPVDA